MAHSIIILCVAVFLLRQTGQGLASHIAVTSMARYHGADRGKALAIASMGLAAAEAILPVLAVLAIATLGWRQTYGWAGLALVLLLLPVSLLLLGDHKERHERHLAASSDPERSHRPAPRGHTRWQVLSDPRFYVLLPAFLAPSYVITALFFHNLTLADGKGWSAAWMTGQYWIYALAAVVASLASGALIDRFTAMRVMPLALLPMAAALVLLAPVEAAIWAIPYMALLGLTSGIAFTGFSALWAELYGATHLGAIRSLASAISVFASALGPVTVGLLLDAGLTMESIALGFAAYCLGATLLLIQALRSSWRRHRSKSPADA